MLMRVHPSLNERDERARRSRKRAFQTARATNTRLLCCILSCFGPFSRYIHVIYLFRLFVSSVYFVISCCRRVLTLVVASPPPLDGRDERVKNAKVQLVCKKPS